MRKGVGGRVLEVDVEVLPFLKEGGGQHRVLLRILVAEGVVIVIE